MPWLVRDGKVLATIEVATSLRERTRGLLGRDHIDGAILLRPAKSVHTLRMRFAIDVAFCDRDLVVLKVVTVARNRVTLPVRRAHAAIEAEAGMMRKWGIAPGDQLHVRGLEDPPVGADLDAPAERSRPAERVEVDGEQPGRSAGPGPGRGRGLGLGLAPGSTHGQPALAPATRLEPRSGVDRHVVRRAPGVARLVTP